MKTQKRLSSSWSLCIGAVGGALVLLVLSGCPKRLEPTTSSSEKKLVVIYTFDENTSAFKVTFGEGARTFTLDDADVGNPLGKLARGKSTEAGVQGITFATKSSPGCITGCVGKYCGTVC